MATIPLTITARLALESRLLSEGEGGHFVEGGRLGPAVLCPNTNGGVLSNTHTPPGHALDLSPRGKQYTASGRVWGPRQIRVPGGLALAQAAPLVYVDPVSLLGA